MRLSHFAHFRTGLYNLLCLDVEFENKSKSIPSEYDSERSFRLYMHSCIYSVLLDVFKRCEVGTKKNMVMNKKKIELSNYQEAIK